MKRLMALLLGIIVGLSYVGIGGAETLAPYAEVRATVPDVWKQTFDTVNGTIEIEVPVCLPDLETLPLYELERFSLDPVEAAAVFPGAEISGEGDYDTLVKMGDLTACIYAGSKNRCAWKAWDPAAAYAENADFSRDELKQFISQALQSLPIPAETTYQPMEIVAYGRTWHATKPDAPLNAHGYYDAHMQMKVGGVSIYNRLWFHRDGGRCYGPTVADMHVTYFDEQNFWFGVGGYRITQMLREECPLLPFAEIQKEIGRYITAGHLRQIYRLELCYVPMWSDDEKAIITMPAWVLHGEYHEVPTQANYGETEDYYLQTIGGWPLVIPAQTGKALDYADTNETRWLASTYLTNE